MINRPKYKVARRLGPSVFDKTQTPKFQLRSERAKVSSRPRPKSEFGIQMIEKQKAKVTYGVNERQFKNYVKNVLETRSKISQSDRLVGQLEGRLDNVIYRLGFAPTRQAARQMVSHGHFCIGNQRVDIPSYQVKIGDVITIREGSKSKAVFANLDEKLKLAKWPSWLTLDPSKKEAKVQGMPKLSPVEINFDIAAVLNFYNR